MTRFGCVLVVLVLGSLLVGCGRSGKGTVPVKGTLTIDGQPADKIQITFAPLEKSLPTASGNVINGSFELLSGVEGDPGAVPGKYKVVLRAEGPALEDAMKAMMAGKGGRAPGGPPEAAGQKPPFPEKYSSASTSDKEVEVTRGSNNIKIEISSS